MNKRGLGRGLGALIPDADPIVPQPGEIVLALPVDSIDPNPEQPRRDFPEAALAALAASIGEQGLLQPIIVRQTDAGRYQLIAGERRWRATKRVGLDTIPALLRETADDQMLPLALIENLVRQNLNPVEEAHAYTLLVRNLGWSHEDVADRVGRSRAYVSNTVRLLQLPTDVLVNVASAELSPGHARALLACDTEDELYRLRDAILDQGLSVREAEERTQADWNQPAPTGSETKTHRKRRKKTTVRSVSAEVRDLEERLQRLFGTPVQVHEKKGRGRVSLEFYSHEDLTRLADLLLKGQD